MMLAIVAMLVKADRHHGAHMTIVMVVALHPHDPVALLVMMAHDMMRDDTADDGAGNECPDMLGLGLPDIE